ncbi:hypothetical protein B842_03460 [Corynebacterium humireducens NBRC 106098 = DSM 45392]|uniref:Uncharacterized protein n=1 Tax=Corynebacterium humireducens NBRC 106098 = DSM 45392 TaxID=1223515 RepID=A0A0B5D140_9CORY|nr:hypothetical protein [Corynebacterium humireducens]AJE32545.1 hypothetical protein B842_03460 [Corynebacterium humireducens NBRC 106098 = DSM 45392]
MTDNPVATIHFNSPEHDPLKIPRPLHIHQEPDGTLTCWGSEAHIPNTKKLTLAGFTRPTALLSWISPSEVLADPDSLTGHQVEIFDPDEDDGFSLLHTIKAIEHV